MTRLLDMGLDPFNFADSLLARAGAARWCAASCTECRTDRPASDGARPTSCSADYMHAFGGEHADRRRDDGARRLACTRNSRDGRLHAAHERRLQALRQTPASRGRAGLHELMVISRELRRLIADRRTRRGARSTRALREGMRTLRQDGIDKVLAGVTSIEEAARDEQCLRPARLGSVQRKFRSARRMRLAFFGSPALASLLSLLDAWFPLSSPPPAAARRCALAAACATAAAEWPRVPRAPAPAGARRYAVSNTAYSRGLRRRRHRGAGLRSGAARAAEPGVTSCLSGRGRRPGERAQESPDRGRQSTCEIEFRVVCTAQRKGARPTLAFVTALQERYALKKSSTGGERRRRRGRVAVAARSRRATTALVKVASETDHGAASFYDRFFRLV